MEDSSKAGKRLTAACIACIAWKIVPYGRKYGERKEEGRRPNNESIKERSPCLSTYLSIDKRESLDNGLLSLIVRLHREPQVWSPIGRSRKPEYHLSDTNRQRIISEWSAKYLMDRQQAVQRQQDRGQQDWNFQFFPRQRLQPDAVGGHVKSCPSRGRAPHFYVMS